MNIQLSGVFWVSVIYLETNRYFDVFLTVHHSIELFH